MEVRIRLQNRNKIKKRKNDRLTHAYVHWLVDMHLAGFAPALASLIFNSPCRFTTANAPANRQIPIASVVIDYYKEKLRTKNRKEPK